MDVLRLSGEEASYELYVGLWANRERAMVRAGLPVSIGAGLALGGGSPEIFNALAESDSEAAYLIGRHRAAEQERKRG